MALSNYHLLDIGTYSMKTFKTDNNRLLSRPTNNIQGHAKKTMVVRSVQLQNTLWEYIY